MEGGESLLDALLDMGFDSAKAKQAVETLGENCDLQVCGGAVSPFASCCGCCSVCHPLLL